MEKDITYDTAYTGSKNFTQHNVKTANANGFAAAADDYMERGIDLNEQLILNKPATFFFRMNGDAMMEGGISSGDVLIVDRSIKPTNGKIIIAAINGELLVRRLQINQHSKTLVAENSRFGNMEITDDLQVWGVITCVIHIYESRLLHHNSNKQKNKEDYRIMY